MVIMPQTFWEFEFFGKDSADIHGIGLREAIREIASKAKVKGKVENVKTNGSVKAVCAAKNEEQANKLFDKIIHIEKPPIKGSIFGRPLSKMRMVTYKPPIPKFKDFAIKREDELSEMVWALQGAGKVFELQQKQKTERLNNSLKYAINLIADRATELKTNGKAKRKFVVLAIDNYIKECPVNDQVLMSTLYDLSELSEKANELAQSRETSDSELIVILDRILQACDSISKIMKKLNRS